MTDTRSEGGFPLLPEVVSGATADVYFPRALAALAHAGLNPRVGMDIFTRGGGIFCGAGQVTQLLHDAGFTGELWIMEDGAPIEAGQSGAQIYGQYAEFGLYETAILGILASCTGWANAAAEIVDAARGIAVASFGARHVHPNVAAIMDYAAIVGGCASCSTPLGAVLSGTRPSGTMPHAYALIVGDTVEAARLFDASMPDDVPRIILVDTFQDEAVESVRVAQALGSRLHGVRLDTPSERGGVTPALVREVRARLDQAGFGSIHITVSGGLTPARIRMFVEQDAPVDAFGVGSYISGAPAVDYTGDIREIEGRPVAKRGRLPGMQSREKLRRAL
ncbi:MAG TPA: nicotinate phosphoribosyltransferase [Chloroflexota bacterium]|nr:nicotinate phosphoribosyltransferase [Chloroflexota bacterium]